MGIQLATAYKMAIECMLEKRREWAFDHSVGQYGVKSPRTRIATEKYEKMTQAMEMLEAEKTRLTTKDKR